MSITLLTPELQIELADLLASATLDADLAGRLRVLWHLDSADAKLRSVTGEGLALLAWQDQSRAPKGTTDGGQWTSGPGIGGGGTEKADASRGARLEPHTAEGGANPGADFGHPIYEKGLDEQKRGVAPSEATVALRKKVAEIDAKVPGQKRNVVPKEERPDLNAKDRQQLARREYLESLTDEQRKAVDDLPWARQKLEASESTDVFNQRTEESKRWAGTGKVASMVESKLTDAGIPFKRHDAGTGSVYFRTDEGTLRVSDHLAPAGGGFNPATGYGHGDADWNVNPHSTLDVPAAIGKVLAAHGRGGVIDVAHPPSSVAKLKSDDPPAGEGPEKKDDGAPALEPVRFPLIEPTKDLPAVAGAFHDPTFSRAAFEQLSARKAMTAQEYAALAQEHRSRAFTMAGVTDEALLTEVKDALAETVKAGGTRADFAKAVDAAFEDFGVAGPSPWRTSLIFRQNTAQAYADGERAQLSKPGVQEAFPFFRYRTAEDPKVRPNHARMDRHVYASSDPIWNEWWPPNGFNCRCWIEYVSRVEAEELKIVTDAWRPEENGVFPDEGFEGPKVAA